MYTGISLTELAQKIEHNQTSKKDYVADTRSLTMEVVGEEKKMPALHMDGIGYTGIDRHAHRQIASRIKIPAPYYERMVTEAPQLLATNVNHWFQEKPERRMVRTLDGSTRAFLSDRYRPLDNFDLAHAALPILADQPDMNIVSCDVNAHRMHVKALFPRIEREVKTGDVVQAGLVISNNEVGAGGLHVAPLVYRLVCLNGMIAESAMKKTHVGRAADGEGALEFFRDETLAADDKAFWMKVQDTIRSAIDASAFARQVNKLAEAAGIRIEADPVEVVERTATRFSLSDGERGDVLRHLIDGGDLSQWGLLNAVTRTSQDVDDYDRATELERVGGRILELPRNDWERIAA